MASQCAPRGPELCLMHFVFHPHTELFEDKRQLHLESGRRQGPNEAFARSPLCSNANRFHLKPLLRRLSRTNFCIFPPTKNTHEAFMQEILGKARNICQFIPLFPDPTLDCDLSVACVLDYADQAVRPSRLILVFSDEEAPAKPREEAHECLHGFLPDAEEGDHSEKPRLAQRRDLQGEFSSSSFYANTPCLTRSYISKVDLHILFNLRDFLVESNHLSPRILAKRGSCWEMRRSQNTRRRPRL